MGVQLQRESLQGFSAAAVLFGQVQIASRLKSYSNLSRQSLRRTYVLLRDSCTVQPVEHSEHAQHASSSP